MSDTITLPLSDLAAIENMLEVAAETAADAQRLLDADDRGWDKITGGTGEFVTREDLRRRSRLARLMAIADPLISRGVNLRVAYVFGQGITIGAHEADDQAAQDVNAVVQAFLEDNTATFTSGQAREAQERCLATDGNLFHRPAGDRLRARPDRRGRSHRADREARSQAAHRHLIAVSVIGNPGSAVAQTYALVTSTVARQARHCLIDGRDEKQVGLGAAGCGALLVLHETCCSSRASVSRCRATTRAGPPARGR